MKYGSLRLAVSALLVSGLVVPVMQARPAFAAAVAKKALSPNGPALKLTFTNPGDQAAVTFSALHNEVVAVATSAGTYAANCDVMVSVKKANGTVIAGPMCGGQAGASGNITIPADATYTIFVDPGVSPAGSLKLALTSSGPIVSITPNAAAVTITANAASTTDFGFIGTSGKRLSASTASGSFANGCDLHFSIIEPNGATVLAASGCAGVATFVDAINNVGAGTYKLRVANTGASSGSVKLTVSQFTDLAHAITANGAAVTSALKLQGQNAALSFTGAVGQQVSFLVTTSTVANGSVHLQRPAGTSVSGTCTAANCFQDSITLDAAGTWQIVIDPSGTSTGSMSVSLFTFSDVDGGAITPNGVAKSLTIATRGQNGSFTFTGAVGQQVSFLVTASTITSGSVHLQRPAGTSVAGTCTALHCFQESLTLDTAGTWKIVIDPSGTALGSMSVQLFTFSDVNGGAITANGAAKSLTIATAGQNGSFTFTGAVGQQVSFLVTASTLTSGSVHLQRPAGTSVSGTCMTLNCFQDSITLDAAGTWKIIIDPSGILTGSITVQLFTFSDVNGGAIVQGGSAASLTIASRGQNGFFTFSGAMGQMAGFLVTASTLTAGSIHFQRPNGTSVSGTCVSVGCTQSTVTLDTAGAWKIIVDPSGTGTGSISIKLT